MSLSFHSYSEFGSLNYPELTNITTESVISYFDDYFDVQTASTIIPRMMPWIDTMLLSKISNLESIKYMAKEYDMFPKISNSYEILTFLLDECNVTFKEEMVFSCETSKQMAEMCSKYSFDLTFFSDHYIRCNFSFKNLETFRYFMSFFSVLPYEYCKKLITTGNLDVVTFLDNQGLVKDNISTYGRFLPENLDVLKYLQKYGTNFNIDNMLLACEYSVEHVEYIASFGILPNNECFEKACGNVKVVKYLVEKYKFSPDQKCVKSSCLNVEVYRYFVETLGIKPRKEHYEMINSIDMFRYLYETCKVQIAPKTRFVEEIVKYIITNKIDHSYKPLTFIETVNRGLF